MALRPASIRNLVPVRLTWHGNDPVVGCCDFQDLAFTDSFFKDTCRRLFAQEPEPEIREIPLSELVQAAAGDPRLEPSGFLFHMSRCGSTVVSWTLSVSERILVLAEPGPVNELLNGAPDIGQPVLIRYLRDLLSLLGRRRRASEELYVVKFSSPLATHLPLIRAAFPTTPWSFVFRDPGEVMVSVLERPTGFLRWKDSPERAARWLQIEPELIPALSREEYVARALARMIECALQESAAAGSDLHRMVGYASLPGAIWTEVAPLFGIRVDGGEEARMRERALFDTKNGDGTRSFEADSQRKAGRVDRRIREQVERWVEEPYQRLLKRARQLRGEGG